jgi:hypothetical protein
MLSLGVILDDPNKELSDGKVDAADYVVWRKTDGAKTDVDGADLSLMVDTGGVGIITPEYMIFI